METTKQSKEIFESIVGPGKIPSFHHHVHSLYDIANHIKGDNLIYVEIGAYGGGSACLMLGNEKIKKVISIDSNMSLNGKSKEITLTNVNRFRVEKENNYHYIEGSSFDTNTINDLLELLNGEKIDILFIDGDHTKSGVEKDFKNYSSLVKNGGYIVFDDYLDAEYCPEVKIAVDGIVEESSDYNIIGSLRNTYGAKPSDFDYLNQFILQKK